VLRLRLNHFGENSVEVATIYQNLANIFEKQGQKAQADEQYSIAKNIMNHF
jgi:hypothetical protein